MLLTRHYTNFRKLHSVQQVLSVQQDLKPDVCPMEIMHGMMHRH